MRIVAGSLRGREILAPVGLEVRPTSDRAREALFNILGPMAGLSILDCYAGTGAVAFEALSRGAGSAALIDRDLGVARANMRALGLQARMIEGDAARPPAAEQPVDIAFLDPPYADPVDGALRGLADQGWFGPETRIVVERAARGPTPAFDGFQLVNDRRYGKARLYFLRID